MGYGFINAKNYLLFLIYVALKLNLFWLLARLRQ